MKPLLLVLFIWAAVASIELSAKIRETSAILSRSKVTIAVLESALENCEHHSIDCGGEVETLKRKLRESE